MDELLNILSEYDNAFAIGTTLYTSVSLLFLLVRKVRSWYRSKSVIQLLGDNKVYIHIPTRGASVGSEQRIKPVIAMEDYNSAEHLRNVLQDYGIKSDIRYIQLDGVIEFSEDRANVVICGPKNSAVIEKYFSDLENAYSVSFKKDANEWYIKTDSCKYYSPIQERSEQYAFVGKTEKFLLICGIHAIGSEGVIHFLRKSSNVDMILKVAKKHKFYGVVKSTYGYNGEIAASEIVQIQEVT